MLTIKRDTARFHRRVLGYVPGQGACNTQVELSTDARFLLLHLASTGRFSIALLRQSAAKLLRVLAEPEQCRIPVWHDNAERWLTVRPHLEKSELPLLHRSGDPAVELQLAVPPDHHIRLVFPGTDLRRQLTVGYLQLGRP